MDISLVLWTTRRWCKEAPATAHMSVDFKRIVGPALFDESVLDDLAREFAMRPSWCVEAVDDDTMLSAFVQLLIRLIKGDPTRGCNLS